MSPEEQAELDRQIKEYMEEIVNDKVPNTRIKNKRKAHVQFMSTEAMKNIYELGYPFEYFEDSCQFAIETPVGVIDYFGINGTWVVRKGQDRGKVYEN